MSWYVTTIALSDAVRSAISKIVTDYRELASRMRASTVAIWKLAYGGSAVRSVSADVILQLALVRDPVLLLKVLRSHSILKGLLLLFLRDSVLPPPLLRIPFTLLLVPRSYYLERG